MVVNRSPSGFAISTYAARSSWITIIWRLGSWAYLENRPLEDLDSLDRVSEELKQMILVAQVPPELEAAIMEVMTNWPPGSRPAPGSHPSSVVSADLTLTFAGQYTSFLNIPPKIGQALQGHRGRPVHPPGPYLYLKNQGFQEGEMTMGVTVMPMVQARVSGVVFTRRPEGTGSEAKIIAGWGRVTTGWLRNPAPTPICWSYEPWGQILDQVILPELMMPVCRPDCGLEEVPVHPDYAQNPLPGGIPTPAIAGGGPGA